MATYQPPKDMKSLSFFSVYRESFNIISTNTKLFTQISIFNILPLSLISLFLIPSTSLLFPDTIFNHLNLTDPPENPNYENLSLFLIYIFAYLVLIIALSLLAFSSVTYAVACICTDHSNITFQATLRAFKRAWKNLVLTRLAIFATMVGFTLLMVLLIIAPVWVLYVSDYRYQTVAFLAISIIYSVYLGGIVYINMVWIFGGVVAVLEGTYGFKALSKSRSLIKGKARWTYRELVPVSLCNYLVAWMIVKVVTNGGLIGLGTVKRIGLGVVGLPVLVGLALFAVVVQVVAYLVCKADKGEGILKSSVMDHLDIFVDGFVYSSLVRTNLM
ncbi:unnamed protein product [Rhodiola kirilowii]